MAYNYQYSKPFSQNGAPVATVNLRTDLIGVSVPTTVSATAPWGHISKDKTLEAFQKYFFAEVKLEGIGVYDIFKVGGGIIGKGTTEDPIILDREWLNDRYMPSFNFPISQVGEPSDFILPISGSYFSVTYPLQSTALHATAFIEGNGDMRLLHHVTNGESIRPVYALWKNYKNTAIDSMQITDVPYEPPGLSADEWVQNVYFASETAMVVEIHDSVGFKEHGFVVLNGTMVSTYHNLYRLGHQVFTELFGLPSYSFGYLGIMRSSGLTAVSFGGRHWIGCGLPAGNAITNAGSSFLMGEVVVTTGGDGVRTRLDPLLNSKTTNTSGNVTNNPNRGFILHQDLSTNDETNKDAMYLFHPPAQLSSSGGLTGVSPGTCMSWSGVTTDGKIVMMVHHYHAAIITGKSQRDLKPIFYYLIDPINRSCIPAPAGWNRRWVISQGPSGALLYENTGITYNTGHYWANGHVMQLVGDGNRLMHKTPGGSDTPHALYVMSNNGTAKSSLDATDDSNFPSNTYAAGRALDPIPPTPLKALGTGYLCYGNLFVVPKPVNASVEKSPQVQCMLTGPLNGKQYLLKNNPLNNPDSVYYGYVLNNQRTLIEGIATHPFVFVHKNTPYYHTASFFKDQNTNDLYGKYAYDGNMQNGKPYNPNLDIYAQMDALYDQFGFPDHPTITWDFKEPNWNWFLIPPYPGVGRQRCIYKIIIGYKGTHVVDGEVKQVTGCYIKMGVIDCTVIVDGVSAKLHTIDTSTIDNTMTYYGVSNLISSGAQQNGRTGGFIRINDDDSWICNVKGGWSMGTLTDAGYGGWDAKHLIVDANNKVTKLTLNPSNITYTGTWHPTLGFGYVDSQLGLGTFYAFRSLTTDGYVDTTFPPVILSSARPAAGFSMTVSADIPVYVTGAMKYIRPQILDLRDTKADPRWGVFYISAEVSAAPDAELVITLDPPVDTENRIYLGKIVTNETEITEMILEPVTRWEGKRVSTEARGSAIIVSTGFPGGPGEITAISAGIDPTRHQGSVAYDSGNKTVTVTNSGSFYIQDKDLAIARFGNFEQTYITVGVDKGRCWINGVEIWKGKGQSSDVIIRNDLLRTGWNTVSVNAGSLTIRGPFLKR